MSSHIAFLHPIWWTGQIISGGGTALGSSSDDQRFENFWPSFTGSGMLESKASTSSPLSQAPTWPCSISSGSRLLISERFMLGWGTYISSSSSSGKSWWGGTSRVIGEEIVGVGMFRAWGDDDRVLPWDAFEAEGVSARPFPFVELFGVGGGFPRVTS